MFQHLKLPTISAVLRDIDKAIRWTEVLSGYLLLSVDILTVSDTSVCLLICKRTLTINYILLFHLSVRYLEIILVARWKNTFG